METRLDFVPFLKILTTLQVFLSINAAALIQEPFLLNVPFIYSTDGSPAQPRMQVDS